PSNYAASLDLDEGVGRLTLGAERGVGLFASSSRSGHAGYYVLDAAGKKRVSVIWREETGPEVALYDAAGEKTSSLSGR
ncbi:MAG: hypothetical protein AB1725_06230, partial [Armatimonadota bacterium]